MKYAIEPYELMVYQNVELMDENDKLKTENAKLRKFAESYLDAVRDCCNICPYDDVDLCDTETDPMRDGCRLYEEMRELGVEVR